MTGDEVPAERLGVVVGVDGSEISEAALAWAATEASLRDVPLEVVLTWEYPPSYGWAPMWPADMDLGADAAKVLDDTVTAVLGDEPPVAVTKRVMRGHPAPVLHELSHNALLLVVGSRGHGGFSGMIIGSVSEYLAAHAHCPVTIVHGLPHSSSGEKT